MYLSTQKLMAVIIRKVLKCPSGGSISLQIIINVIEVTFSDFVQKILCGPFWPIRSKKNPLWPKMNISASFSKSVPRIFLVLHIKTYGSIYEITMWKLQEKSGSAHFRPFLFQICPFFAQNQHSSLYPPNSSLDFDDFWFTNLS